MSEAGDVFDNVTDIREADWGAGVVGEGMQSMTDGVADNLAAKLGLDSDGAREVQSTLRTHTIAIVKGTQDSLAQSADQTTDSSVGLVDSPEASDSDVIDLDSERASRRPVNDDNDVA